MLLRSIFLVVAVSLPSIVSAQLASGYSIGPLTTSDAKWAVKVCDVTKYGAVADGVTDIGPPLLAAFNACKTGGIGEPKAVDSSLWPNMLQSTFHLEPMPWLLG
jgi:rhamnogalacturonan hydrolase